MKSCIITVVFVLSLFIFSFQFVSAQFNRGRVSTASLKSVNYALEFDGVDDIVNVNTTPSLVLSNALTIETWVIIKVLVLHMTLTGL